MESNIQQYCNKLESGVDQVRQLSSNFCEALGLTTFAYVRVYHDGRLGWVTSNADQDRLLIESGAILEDPLVDKATLLKKGRYLWFNNREFPGCEAFYRDRAKLFGMDHGMVVVNHQKDHLETCCFSGLLAKRPLYNLFMNETGIFRLFMQHFKKQLTPSLLHIIEEGLMLEDVKHSYEQSRLKKEEISSEQRLALVSTCGWGNLLQLSLRERECLELLRKGHTYQQIGNLLTLSQRTIEHYLDSVKNKLGLETRADLYLVADQLEVLGLLPHKNFLI